MSRQLRISDDTHDMLTLLKPHKSATFDDVIHDLISDVCPSLPDKIENLRRLEKEDPRKAKGEWLILEKEIFEDVIVERMFREREDAEERELDAYLDSQRPEEDLRKEKEIDEEYRIISEKRRQFMREKLLREQESISKNE
jgi:hypothetical protein